MHTSIYIPDSDRPGFNKKSRVTIYPKDILKSLEPTKKLVMWAYAKNVSKKYLKYYFDMNGPSEDLFFDLAILSGAKAEQVKRLKGDDEKCEDLEDLINRNSQVVLKVIKTKLKELYIMDHKKHAGSEIRAVHLEILQRNLLH